MKPITVDRRVNRRFVLRPYLLLLCLAAVTTVGRGAPPIDPLPAPDYSFDLMSCAVDGGVVDAGDVLILDFPDPNVLLPRDTLGLWFEEDDLDALSAANAGIAPDTTFGLLFSVDAGTVGAVPPDSLLIELHVPYNVMDQAGRGHAAGDQFMSTHLFTRLGGQGGFISNSVMTRNNYDEGGTDFSAQPPTSADGYRGDDSLDIVDATSWLTRLGQAVVDVYFSVTSTSPSLDTLPSWGIPSGADIYVNEAPLAYAPTELYAPYEQLHLDQADDIDALIVFDINENGWFDGSDQVLFSLAPGSPSLDTIPGASPEGAAADVFVVSPGQTPTVFASAADLGLGAVPDNINALDFFLCDDVLSCAALHGIRSVPGDVDDDGDVDLADLAALLASYGTCEGDPLYNPAADFDFSGCIDLADLAALLAAYGP